MYEKNNLNILFIAIDTLRADHLGCYGYSKDTSPDIDKLAEMGVLFKNAFAEAIPTQPSFTTMLTGTHPLNHGIVCHNTSVALSPEIPMLPQILRDHGYTTVAIDNLATNYMNVPWFVRGYDYYINSGGKRVISFGAKIFAERANQLATSWLRNQYKNRNKPFFMFIHYWDPHAPYRPPQEYVNQFYKGNPKDPKNKDLEKVKSSPSWVLTWKEPFAEGITDPKYVEALYDGEIVHVSSEVGNLLNELDELELTEETLVVLTADHGEGMGENGIYFDHFSLYDFDINIPLIMTCKDRLPYRKRLEGIVKHTDIAPTILDIAGITKHERLDGQSLLPIMSEQEYDHSPLICLENSRMTDRAIRTSEWKLIETLRPDFCGRPEGWLELYNIKQDPNEKENLFESESEIAFKLLAHLEIRTRRMLKNRKNPLVTQEISLLPPPHPSKKIRRTIKEKRKDFALRLEKTIKEFSYMTKNPSMDLPLSSK